MVRNSNVSKPRCAAYAAARVAGKTIITTRSSLIACQSSTTGLIVLVPDRLYISVNPPVFERNIYAPPPCTQQPGEYNKTFPRKRS